MPPASAVSTGEELLKALDGRAQKMGGVLRCKKNKLHPEIPLGDVDRYRETGWPQCCGRTMTWVTAAEVAEEQRRLRRRRERYK